MGERGTREYEWRERRVRERRVRERDEMEEEEWRVRGRETQSHADYKHEALHYKSTGAPAFPCKAWISCPHQPASPRAREATATSTIRAVAQYFNTAK